MLIDQLRPILPLAPEKRQPREMKFLEGWNRGWSAVARNAWSMTNVKKGCFIALNGIKQSPVAREIQLSGPVASHRSLWMHIFSCFNATIGNHLALSLTNLRAKFRVQWMKDWKDMGRVFESGRYKLPQRWSTFMQFLLFHKMLNCWLGKLQNNHFEKRRGRSWWIWVWGRTPTT